MVRGSDSSLRTCADRRDLVLITTSGTGSSGTPSIITTLCCSLLLLLGLLLSAESLHLDEGLGC